MKHKGRQIIKIITTNVSLLYSISFLFIPNNADAQCSATIPSWCKIGNSNTTTSDFVGTSDAVPLIFRTNNTEWMRIDILGNVGIFTPTPSYKLDVTGDINLTGALRIGANAGLADQVLTSTAGGANIWTNPITSVTGTAPIISSGGFAPIISIPQSNATTDGYLSFANWNTFNNKVNGIGIANYLARWTSSNNITTGATFDNGTNVGIGTANPQAKFEVQDGCVTFEGTGGGPSLLTGSGTRMMWVPSKAAFRAGTVFGYTWDDVNIGTSSAAFGINTSAKSYASFVIGMYNKVPASFSSTTWVPTDQLFVIGNGDHITQKNAMTVLKNGNVGILTTTPKNKLDVQGGIAIGNTYAGTILAPADGAIIKGKVGIGTATPSEKLDVAGNIKVNLNQIYFKDANHGLGYFITYEGKAIDGPVLYGYTAGALGTKQAGSQKIALYWNSSGNVGIGTTLTGATYDPNYKLAVNGAVRAKRFVVETNWSDFVFEKNYKLLPLEKVEEYIKQNGHLPEMPCAKEVETNGGDLGNLVKLQMQKIEELTLYAIEQNKKIEELSQQIKSQKK